MIVSTTRFGDVRVRDDRLLHFPQGLLGYAHRKQFALIQPGDDNCFFWLQSIDTPSLAFVVTDPNLFIVDYHPPLRPDQLETIGVRSMKEVQLLVIVNRRGHRLTGNLRGPLVIQTKKKLGLQVVLCDTRFHTRVPLVDLAAPMTEGVLASVSM